MRDKKHIDRLFQERFKDFEATPSDTVWKHIEARLNQNKKKDRIIPIWWRYAGVAALVMLLLTIGGVYFNNDDSMPTNQITNTEDDTTRSTEGDIDSNISMPDDDAIANSDTETHESDAVDKTQSQIDADALLSKGLVSPKDASIAETEATSNNKTIKTPGITNNHKQNNFKPLVSNKNEAIARNTAENNNTNKVLNKSKHHEAIATNHSKEETTETLKNAIDNNTSVAKDSETDHQENTSLINQKRAKELINSASENSNAVAKTKQENSDVVNGNTEENNLSIEDAIDNNKNIAEDEKNTNKWSIAPNAAPVYFNTLGKGSSLDPQFNANSKSGELNMSYGITASYAINNKISIRSGINRVNLGYNTEDAIAFQSVGVSSSSRDLQNVNAVDNRSNPANETFSLVSGESFIPNSDIPEDLSTSSISINQDLGFIEIPLEIQYALSNKKLGVNLIGGFSSFFLNNNRVFSESNGERQFYGVASNINKVSYSANFGFGLHYHLTEKLDLNFEPMFKYQINTFNNTSGDFQPFFLGVYTGFAIKF